MKLLSRIFRRSWRKDGTETKELDSGELKRLKTDFVSTISHELRTPLTAIKGSVALILGGVTGPITPETKELLIVTQKNTERLLHLINEVLDIAKIEAGAVRLKLGQYPLVDIITHAVVDTSPMARSRGISIAWEAPETRPIVVVDRHRIGQVIVNLLSNAIKFSEEGSVVTVTCECTAWEVTISVKDTGIGIPEEYKDRIFEKFSQAEDSTHKATEGTGLGLAISKAIVEDHGGKISVESLVGAGSVFTFTIPWNGKDVEEPPEAKSSAA